MVDIHRILCPIDFSTASRHALDHALAMAKWYESQLTAYYVAQAPSFVPQPPIFFAEPSHGGAALSDEREIAERELHAMLAPAEGLGIQTEVLIEAGEPARRIVDCAATLPADLIVMGTHGHSGFDRLMLGSVTEKVLRRAACPVLTVPPAAVTAAKVPYTRVLCPIDFSDSSLAAFQFAASIAQESDAQLTLLNVIDWPPDDELLVEHTDPPGIRELVEQRARERLDQLLTDDVRTWCKPSVRIGYGKPYRHILAVAGEEQTDLIVIGVRGRQPWNMALFGSTTNQVVRSASCPVLTLKR
jgi:nucleotide-binding universal stress UspA family protein